MYVGMWYDLNEGNKEYADHGDSYLMTTIIAIMIVL